MKYVYTYRKATTSGYDGMCAVLYEYQIGKQRPVSCMMLYRVYRVRHHTLGILKNACSCYCSSYGVMV